jgi:tetratricopeptide (TPR) repeat protein
MTAADFDRARRRKWTIVAGILAAVIALTAFGWKLRIDPVKARQAFEGGDRLLRTQRYNEAAISFSRTIGLQPKFTEAYYLRGKSYLALFQWDKAIADFTKLIEQTPADPRPYRARALAWLEKKNLDNVMADTTKAIELDPRSGGAYNLRGVALVQKKQMPEALADFNKAIELEPNADNYFQRGSLFQATGEYQKAEADFTTVIEYMPDASHPYYARSAVRRAIGDEAGAVKDHRMARRLEGGR